MMKDVEVGDVKIFTLNTLLELMGKIEEITDDYYVLDQTLVLRLEPQKGEDGREAIGAALAPLSMFVDKDEKSQGARTCVYFSSLLAPPSDPPEGILNYYAQLTGSILAPPTKKIQMPT